MLGALGLKVHCGVTKVLSRPADSTFSRASSFAHCSLPKTDPFTILIKPTFPKRVLQDQERPFEAKLNAGTLKPPFALCYDPQKIRPFSP